MSFTPTKITIFKKTDERLEILAQHHKVTKHRIVEILVDGLWDDMKRKGIDLK